MIKNTSAKGQLILKKEGSMFYLYINGKRIARRRRPDNPEEHGTWIPLEPGFKILDGPDLRPILINRQGVRSRVFKLCA